MSIKLTPEVTQVVKPAEVTITLSVHDAKLLMALLGKCNEDTLVFPGLYRQMLPLLGHSKEYSRIVSAVIKDDWTQADVLNFTASKSQLQELANNPKGNV